MVKCQKCGKELYMPFVCSYCNQSFCSEHRIPESHNCKDLVRGAEHVRPTPVQPEPVYEYTEPVSSSTRPSNYPNIPEIDADDIPPDADDYEEYYDPDTGETMIRYYIYDRSGFKKFFLPVPKLVKPDKPIGGITSKIELLELGLATVLMAFIAWTLFREGAGLGNYLTNPLLIVLSIALPIVFATLGFLGHELAHKGASMKLGHWSEFRFIPFFLCLTFVSFIFSILALIDPFYAPLAMFKFLLPGAVMVPPAAGESYNKMGKIAIAGPLFNFIVAGILIAFAVIIPAPAVITPSDVNTIGVVLRVSLVTGALLNIVLGLFNCIPIAILDGKKIWKWKKIAWILIVVALATEIFVLFFLNPSGILG